MLAKEIKIATIMKQRAFIEKMIRTAKLNHDGDPATRYVGYVYPENIEYFKKEGFIVTRHSSDLMLMAGKGLPIYIFTPQDEITLTEEEMKLAESSNNKPESAIENLKFGPSIEDILAEILGGPTNPQENMDF